jgi:hypothetical protein
VGLGISGNIREGETMFNFLKGLLGKKNKETSRIIEAITANPAALIFRALNHDPDAPRDWDLEPLCLQVNVESWLINLGYSYSMNVSVPTYDAFRLMLQRRWLKCGLLPPHRMRSEPMSPDLSPWAASKQ